MLLATLLIWVLPLWLLDLIFTVMFLTKIVWMWSFEVSNRSTYGRYLHWYWFSCYRILHQCPRWIHFVWFIWTFVHDWCIFILNNSFIHSLFTIHSLIHSFIHSLFKIHPLIHLLFKTHSLIHYWIWLFLMNVGPPQGLSLLLHQARFQARNDHSWFRNHSLHSMWLPRNFLG